MVQKMITTMFSTGPKRKQQTRNCQNGDRGKDRSHHYTAVLNWSGWGHPDLFMQLSVHLTADRHYD